MVDEDVVVTLTREEALVVFEWLAKLEAADSPPFDDPAEEVALLRLHARLESSLVEPFAANYRELLREARRVVRERYGGI